MSDILKFYFSFEGRATRFDFNIRYALVAIIGSMVAGIMDFAILGDAIMLPETIAPFSSIWNLLVFISTFAVICKRLHDMGYSGWWQLGIHGVTIAAIAVIVVMFGMAFILNPLIAGASGLLGLGAIGIFYLVFFIALSVKRGTIGPNQYGADPLEVVTI